MKLALLVEDHALFRQALAHLLEWRSDAGQVAQAGSVAEGRWRVGVLDGSIDVAVVDLSLPDGDAAELVRAIREREPQIPILVLAQDRRDREGLRRALEAGADEAVCKDASVEDVLGAVRRLVAAGEPEGRPSDRANR